MTQRLEARLRGILAREPRLAERGSALAKEIAKEVVAASESVGLPPEDAAAVAFHGVTQVLTSAGVPPEAAVEGAAQGVVLGAGKADGDIQRALGVILHAAATAQSRGAEDDGRAMERVGEGVKQATEELRNKAGESTEAFGTSNKLGG